MEVAVQMGRRNDRIVRVIREEEEEEAQEMVETEGFSQGLGIWISTIGLLEVLVIDGIKSNSQAVTVSTWDHS